MPASSLWTCIQVAYFGPSANSKFASCQGWSYSLGQKSLHHKSNMIRRETTALICFVTGGCQRPLNVIQAQGGQYKICPLGGENAGRGLTPWTGLFPTCSSPLPRWREWIQSQKKTRRLARLWMPFYTKRARKIKCKITRVLFYKLMCG